MRTEGENNEELIVYVDDETGVTTKYYTPNPPPSLGLCVRYASCPSVFIYKYYDIVHF